MPSPQTAGESPATSVYQRVTDLVLAELAKGVAPWRKPWRAEFGLPRNLASGRPYRGLNVLVLMTAALSASYEHNWWVTFHQARERGGHVNKGEHGYPIIFYRKLLLNGDGEPAEDEEAAEDDPDRRWRPVLKTFTVFNLSQCSGVTAPPAADPPAPMDPVATAEQIVAAVGIPVHYAGTQAYYQPQADRIIVPPRACFESPADFYSTVLHETVHATGHQSRLNRPSGPFGSAAYAWEELIAELGSAMLAVITGVPSPDFPNIAGYIAAWRMRLASDARAIGEAAAAAQKAVEWLLAKAGLSLPV